MKNILSIAALLIALTFGGHAQAAGTAPANMTASGAIVGTQIVWCPTGLTADLKCTFTQVAAYINSLVSGDCTATGTGAFTCTKTNGTAFGALATVTPGTGVATLLAGASSGTGGPAGTTSPTFTTPALGTPSALVGTNITGTGAGFTAGNVTTNANLTGMVTSVGNAASLGSFTSANLSGALTDETGTGSAVFGTAPTMSSPTINTAMTLGFLTGAGTECMQVSNTGVVSGTGSACGGSGSTGANPTATASDTAVNGVATTFMRSDAAPAVQKTSASVFGLAKVDGTTITAASGVITAVPGVTSRTVTGATDTILAADRGNVVYYNSASSIAVTQPAPSGSFAAGFFTTLCNVNTGIPTVTPGSGTIINGSTYAIPAGISFASASCVSYQSDGTNFNAVDIQAAYGTGVQAALGKAANGTGGFGTVGTSGATLPLLNGTNTFSGTQTFGSVFGTVSTQSGTTYTLASTDCGTEIAFTNAAAVTVTIPAALTTGCNIVILQTTSAGQVTVTGTAVSAATLHSAHSFTKTFGQWAAIGINIYTTGVAILTGDGA